LAARAKQRVIQLIVRIAPDLNEDLGTPNLSNLMAELGGITTAAHAPSRCPLMGWSGRAPAPPAIEAGKGRQDKEHAMSQKLDTSPAAIGIDIGNNSFHIVGQNQRGTIVLRQKWSRGQVEARLANMPPCLIGMEACVGAHHLSRRLQALGHDDANAHP
jgi:hypothetical protein